MSLPVFNNNAKKNISLEKLQMENSSLKFFNEYTDMENKNLLQKIRLLENENVQLKESLSKHKTLVNVGIQTDPLKEHVYDNNLYINKILLNNQFHNQKINNEILKEFHII